MLIQCITITENLPHQILSCINSILNQTYDQLTYDIYIKTELDSEELLYKDLLAQFANDSRLKFYFIPNILPYENFHKNYDSIYLEINPLYIYSNKFFESIINDFDSDYKIIHYLPKFYIQNNTILKNNHSNLACTAINKTQQSNNSDIRYTTNIIGNINKLQVQTNKIYHIDNKYCGIYWFNHPKWQSYIYLNKRNNRVYHINNDDHGKYEHLDNNKIKIIWDKYPEEIFQRIDNETSITYNA